MNDIQINIGRREASLRIEMPEWDYDVGYDLDDINELCEKYRKLGWLAFGIRQEYEDVYIFATRTATKKELLLQAQRKRDLILERIKRNQP